MRKDNKYNEVIKELYNHADENRAQKSTRFFKTNKGDYAQNDIWIGVPVPLIRKIAKQYKNISFDILNKLISSKIHEERLLALFIIIYQYKQSDESQKKNIAKYYLKNIKYINNWDLVDSSAYHILGEYLLNKDKKILMEFAHSKNMWERRISIVSTFAFIKNGDHKVTHQISEILLNDKEDLIHKSVGWMLREAGKRVSEKSLFEFLDKNKGNMPRTMLRYAIEKIPNNKRVFYLKS